MVEESDGDLMGDSVNIAARLEGIADPGGICLSEDAYRQVRDRLKEGFADLGEKELKNIARPVRVFAIKTGSSGVTQELIASTPELGGDPEQEYFGGRQARRCGQTEIQNLRNHVRCLKVKHVFWKCGSQLLAQLADVISSRSMAFLQRHENDAVVDPNGRAVGKGKIVGSRRQPNIVDDKFTLARGDDFAYLVLDRLEELVR